MYPFDMILSHLTANFFESEGLVCLAYFQISKFTEDTLLKARQGKARQGKARQGKVRQGKARQGKARQGKARQGKARQGKARQFIQHNSYTRQFKVLYSYIKSEEGK